MTPAFVTRAFLGLCMVLACGSAAIAQEDVAAFYKGKTMRIVVGIGVGSGYDINARLLARHMAAHIPGQSDDHRAEPAGRRQPDDDQRSSTTTARSTAP